MIDTKLFKAALLLDPRFNKDLSETEKSEAIKFLESLVERINICKGQKQTEAQSGSNGEYIKIIYIFF